MFNYFLNMIDSKILLNRFPIIIFKGANIINLRI